MHNFYSTNVPVAAAAPSGSSAGYYSSEPYSNRPLDIDERMRKFQSLVARYEINRDFATRLRALEGYEIVFIVDGKSIRLTSD